MTCPQLSHSEFDRCVVIVGSGGGDGGHIFHIIVSTQLSFSLRIACI